MVETSAAFFGWSIVWILTLVLPPGSRAIDSAYRINFLHGLLSSVVAALSLMGYVDTNIATMATISYFIVDFVNILLNDFYFKVKSYQSPPARKMEYVHHILCCTAGVMSEFMYKDFCSFDINPFPRLMFAELSTPFLIAWRYTEYEFLGFLFVLTFIGCRIIYQGLFLIPECMEKCHYSVGYGFGIPFNLMNIYFVYMIFKKLFKEIKKKKKKKFE